MTKSILLDTGPLVALLDAADMHHAWAVSQWAQMQSPLLTCEPVLAEACYLLRHEPRGVRAVMELVERQVIQVAFRLDEHVETLSQLLGKYANVPMSLADACLVRMAELQPPARIFTLDADFRIYRKHGRQVVPVVAPDGL